MCTGILCAFQGAFMRWLGAHFRVRDLERAGSVQGDGIRSRTFREAPPTGVPHHEVQTVARTVFLHALVLVVLHVRTKLSESEHVQITVPVHISQAGKVFRRDEQVDDLR